MSPASHVRVDGHKVAFSREGSGEPVLLIHGITTASFIWRRIVPLLSPRYDVIAVDLLGFGASQRSASADLSLNAHAERILLLLEKLGLERVHLVGHDLGGGIAQILAIRRPALFTDVALLNPVGYDYWPVPTIRSMRTPVLRHLAMATLNAGVLGMIVRRGLYHRERLTPELLELFRQQISAPEARKPFLRFARCLDSRNLTDIAGALATLPMPVLIVRGDADVYLTPLIAERLHREIPGSRLVRIPTAGHFLQEDEPELVAGALLAHFAGRAHG